MAAVLLIHHAANRGFHHPPNSLAGLAACLAAGARAVEVDVQALADGDFALLHDAMLEESTTGRGPVGAQTATGLRELRLVWRGQATGEPVALLSQAVALLCDGGFRGEVQLDLKAYATSPLTEERLRSLVRLVEPLEGPAQVRVSSQADWSLRRLHALAPDLSLGFDPLLYLDLRPPDEDPQMPPYRRGAYGYRDDHPLAMVRWGPAGEYLAERAEALWAQAPWASAWYIRARVLERALDDGFDWIALLHERGVVVDAWTLDAHRPEQVALARRLVAAGVDRLTTNDPPALAAVLGREALL